MVCHKSRTVCHSRKVIFLMKFLTIVWCLVWCWTPSSAQDTPCPATSPCTATSSCPWYQRQLFLVKSLPESNRDGIVSTLRSSVCNVASRKVCCRPVCGELQTCKHHAHCQWYQQKKEDQQNLVKGSPEFQQITKQLQRSVCDKDLKKVCCPKLEEGDSMDPLEKSEAMNPSEKTDSLCLPTSSCVSSSSCPWYQRELQALTLAVGTGRYDELLQEIKASVCSKSQRKVCCPNQQSDQQAFKATVSGDSDSPSWLPSAAVEECGQGMRLPARIINGNSTRIGEFPSAVLLGRQRDQKEQIYWFCGGTLINRWFVVTAAHCAIASLAKVRAGEWRVVDTSQPDVQRGLRYSASQRQQCPLCLLVDGNVDCEVVSGGQRLCGPPHQDLEVHKVMRHPGYHILRRTGVGIHDIALVRLKTPATLNALVSPACLPLDRCEVARSLQLGGDEASGCHLNDLAGKTGVAVGWGQTYTQSDELVSLVASHIQAKVELPVVRGAECGRRYSDLFRKNVTGDISREELMCAGGEPGKDTCKGDSGGQLVIQTTATQWLMGVVATGTKYCGIGLPAIFTNVDFYVDWIKQNIG